MLQKATGISNCMHNGTDCPTLNLHTMDSQQQLLWKTLYALPGVAAVEDTHWFRMVAPVTFPADLWNSSALYQQLYIAGPEEGVDIYVEDFSIKLPTGNFYPDDSDPGKLCDDLIINGDAEASSDGHYFPWELEGNRGAHLSVKTEPDGNQYFAVEGRTKKWTSIKATLLHDCIVRNSIYKFNARVRLHSPEVANVRFTIRTHIPDPEPAQPPYIVDSVGDCPPVSEEIGWVSCERNFLFREMHESAIKIEFIFVVEGDDTSDIDYDNVVITRTAHPINKIIVPQEVVGCWGVGAEVLTTSHTLNHYDHNLDNITDIQVVDGKAVLTLQNKIAKPTTVADDPNYAVEVALLSRNIRFAPAEDDPANPFHGGHLMVVHTPHVKQTIHGVEFRRFGQMGNLGRYPIHIHLSTNGTGISIARNTIRESNQRCVVIHGTHNTTVEYNIAYDTFGHCYMLEDGFEQDNHFNYNLGASTKITPEEGVLSLAESDQFASTFWLSNPKNYILGNVAAGSEDTGIWIELLELVRGPSAAYDPYFDINPSTFEYGYFRDNVAHSNKGDGFKLYPNGYFPETEAVFENTLSYRNTGDGVLLHNSRNLAIDGGIYADNRIQIEVDKQADDVRVSNALVIGYSPLYQIEVEAGNRKTHCPAYRPLVGIQLHSFLRYRDSDGYILDNITFSDYGEAIGCTNSSAIEMDPQVRDGHFDAFATFSNITFANPDTPMKEKFNMCFLAENPLFIHDLAIQDLTGDLNPNGNNEPGWIISDSQMMTAFQPDGNCYPMEGSCSLYCEGGCYRTMNYAVNVASEYDDMVLEVTRDDGTVTEFPGYFEWKTKIVQNVEVLDDYENYVYQRRKYYSPIVPNGSYTMRFKLNGAVVWPEFVEETWEDPPSCGPYVSDGNITLVTPTSTGDNCDNVIRHGDAEQGTRNLWMHSGGGLQVVEPGYNSAYAFSSVLRKGTWQGPGQFLDTRCLVEGNQYEISMRVKLLDNDGNPQHCDVNREDINAYDVCPRVSLRVRQLAGNRIGDPVDVSYAYPLALTVGPYNKDEWNFIYGVFTVTQSIATADAVFLFVDRARPGVNIVIDDAKMVPTVHSCAMPVYNTDFEVGDARFWSKLGTAKTDIYSPGYGGSAYALRTTERKEFWSSMSQALNSDCLVEGTTYDVSVFILLLDENDNMINCDPSLSWGSSTDNVCPTMSLRVTTGTEYVDIDVGSVTGTWTSGDWNAMHGSFTPTQEMLVADSVRLFFRKFKEGKNIVIDDVSIVSVEASDPNQLMNNGDFSAGDTRHFYADRGGETDTYSPGFDDDFALINRDRTFEYFGVRQSIDTNVIEEDATYKLEAKVKLFAADEVTPFDCDPAAVGGDYLCPVIYLRSQEPAKATLSRFVGSVKGPWVSGEWNTIEGLVVFFHYEIHAPSLNLVIDRAPEGVVVVLDNISMSKVTATA